MSRKKNEVSLSNLIIYNIGEYEFCSELINIADIVKFENIDIQQSDDIFSLKEIYHHNNRIPLINVSNILKIEHLPNSGENRIIIFELKQGKAGFVVDYVKEIITVDECNLLSVNFFPISDREYIRGLVNYEKNVYFYIDYEEVFKYLIIQFEMEKDIN